MDKNDDEKLSKKRGQPRKNLTTSPSVKPEENEVKVETAHFEKPRNAALLGGDRLKGREVRQK